MPLAPGHWAVPDNATPTRLAKDANALSWPDGAVLRAAQGNMTGGPLANGRSLALPGSKDCNLGSATPSDVRGNRCIIVGRPRSWQNSLPEVFTLRLLEGRMGFAQCYSAHFAVKQHSWLYAE